MYIQVEECTAQNEIGNVKYVFDLEDYVSVDNITLAKTFKTLTQMRYMTYADCVFTVAVFTDVDNNMWITADDETRIC
jgi:hypothetical protein